MRIKDFYKRYINIRYGFDPFRREFQELLHLERPYWKNFKEELNDCFFTLQCAIHERTGLDWEMIWSSPSIAKVEDRLVWFNKFSMEKFGIPFDIKYWKRGSNYKRPEKVQWIFEQMKKDLGGELCKTCDGDGYIDNKLGSFDCPDCKGKRYV